LQNVLYIQYTEMNKICGITHIIKISSNMLYFHTQMTKHTEQDSFKKLQQ